MTPEPHKSVPGSLSAAFGAKVAPKKPTGSTVRRGAPKPTATPTVTAAKDPVVQSAGLHPTPTPAGQEQGPSLDTTAPPAAAAQEQTSGAPVGPPELAPSSPPPVPQIKQRWTLFIDEDVSEAVKAYCAGQKMTRADLVMVAYNKTHQQLPDLLVEEQRHLSDPGDMFPVVAKPISRAKKQLAVNVPVSFAQHIDRQVQELAAPDRSHTINVLLRAYLQL